MAAVPIWKDKIVDLNATDTQFRIVDSSTSENLYVGKADAKPGENTAKIRINDICADYLENALPTLTDRTFTSLGLRSFQVYSQKPSWTLVETVQFYNDWSYDHSFSGNILSLPINGRVDNRMPILYTGLNLSTVIAIYRRTSGTSTYRTISVPNSPDDGTGVFFANAVSNVREISINGRYYYPVGSCYKFALYYINAYGGWDQFLIEGNDLEVDNLERHIYGKEYDNASIVNAGEVNYVNEITKTWTLHSGLLTDDQASRMHHLLNSCLVYLCDIATGDMIPVTITTNTCEYKTFKNQGRRMADYTFTIQLAQNRIRR